MQASTSRARAAQDFDDAAVEAARQFVFAPGEAGGKPVPVRITYAYRFLFKPPPPPPAPAPQRAAADPDRARRRARAARRRSPAARRRQRPRRRRRRRRPPPTAPATSASTPPVGQHTSARRRPRDRPQRLQGHAHRRQVAHDHLVRARPRALHLDGARRSARRRGGRADPLGRRAAPHPRHAGRHAQGGAEPARRRALAVRRRAPRRVGLGAARHAHLRRRRLHPDALSLRRPALDGEQRDGLVARSSCPAATASSTAAASAASSRSRRATRAADGYHGFVQLDLIDGSLMVEGPITKNLSFAVGARRCVDRRLPAHLHAAATSSSRPSTTTIRPSCTGAPRRATTSTLFIFGSDDAVKLVSKGSSDPALQAAFDSHTYYHRILARWLHRFASRATLTVTPSVGYDVPFQFNAQIGNTLVSVDAETLRVQPARRLRASRSAAGCASTPASTSKATAGTSSVNGPQRGMPREGDAGGGFGGAFAFDKETLDQVTFAPYVALNFTPFKNLLIMPQLRLETFDFRGYQTSPDAFDHTYFLVEPRALGALADQQVGGGQGRGRRLSSAARSVGVPEVVRQPGGCCRNTAGTTSSAPTSSRPRRCTSRPKGSTRTCRTWSCAAPTRAIPTLTNEGQGRVYGGELLVRQELWKGFFGWIAYTLSRSERKRSPERSVAPVPVRPDAHPHPHRQLQVRARLSGRHPLPLRHRQSLHAGHRLVLRRQLRRLRAASTGPLYSARLGSFNQLDVRFDKKWTFHRWALVDLRRHPEPL